jgi:hypothetical protein
MKTGVSMQNLSYTDKIFSADDCSLYDLTVICCLDGFSLMIRQPESKSVLHFQHFPFRYAGYQMLLRSIKELIPENKLLSMAFRKTTIVLGDRHLVLIPGNLWSVKLPEYLFPEKKKFEAETETVVIPLSQIAANLVFRTGKELFDFLTLTFPGAEITHETSPLILTSLSDPAPALIFYFHSGWFWALSAGDGKLSYINSFEYNNETDMLYFMLAVVRTFRPGESPVILSGWIDEDDTRFRMIRKYLPDAKFPAAVGPVADTIPLNRYLYGFFSL